MPTRKEVYEAIDTERAYQDLANKRTLTIGEEIALLVKYTNIALDEWADDFSYPEREALNAIRKVAGICVRCLEHHEAPRRTYIRSEVVTAPTRQISAKWNTDTPDGEV